MPQEAHIDEKDAFVRQEEEQFVPARIAPVIEGMTPNQILAAYKAALNEHKLSNRASIRIYLKAVLWITSLAFVVFQEQFDSNLTNSFQAFPAFQRQFGTPVLGKKGQYQLHPWEQTLLSNMSSVGHLVGFLINGYLVDRIGNRWAILGALCFQLCTTFPLFFARNFGMIVAGQVLHQAVAAFCGGVAPAYAIELAPLTLRPYAPVYVHFLQILGNLTASGVEQSFSTRLDQWAWRIPYAIQWAFPLPLLVFGWFAPESPWWLVRKGRCDEALVNLRRLNNGEADDEGMISLIQHTVQLEKALKFGSRYIDVFKGVNLRRTEIAFMACLSQSLSGFALRSGAYFFQAAGMSPKNSFTMQCAQFALGLVGTALAMFTFSRYGRRTLWLIGTGAMAATLSAVGGLALAPRQTPSVIWPQGVFMLFHFFFNNLSVGPLSFILSVEIGSVHLRRKTISIGRAGYDIVEIVSGSISPFLLNPTAANLKGKTAWIAAGLCVLMFIYGFFRVPETKDRNSEELDILFAEKVPARKFSRYVISSEQQFGLSDPKGRGEELERVTLPTA